MDWKKFVLGGVAMLLLSGCAGGTVSLKKDGTCSAAYISVLKSAEEINLSACGARGGASKTQQDLSSVLTSALIRGLEASR